MSTEAITLNTPLVTITLEDVAAYGNGITEADLLGMSEADLYELRKRVEEGTMSGFEDVAEAAWYCVLLDRERRAE
jgi:hypothetical protein